MADPMTIAALGMAAGAVGNVGLGAYGASQAGGGPDVSRIRLSPETRAMQSLAGRQMAYAANVSPMSFTQWVNSGGQATGWEGLPQPTPWEAEKMRFVTPGGEEYPTYSLLAGGDLTPEQVLMLGKESVWRAPGGAVKTGKQQQRLARVQSKMGVVETKAAEKGWGGKPREKFGGLTKREHKYEVLKKRKASLMAKLGGSTE